MKVKFLVIRFSSIGDIVLTTPVVRCLKQQVEGAEVHFLTKPAFLPLIQYNPYIDKILLLKEKLTDTIAEINNESYDYLIDLHHNIRTFLIKKRVPRISFSFPKLTIEKWLLVNFKINKLPDKHVVDRYFETVKLFDVSYDNQGLDLFIPDSEEVSLLQLPESFQQGYVAIAVGAKHETKRIPETLLIEIIRQLPVPFVLLGDAKDSLIAEKIQKQVIHSQVYNACGKYSLLQSASLVKQAKVVITADTGLMHIAAAFNKKIVSIWGNTIPQFGMYPFTAKENYSIFEVKGLACRPCSKLGYKKCPRKHFRCMTEQNIPAIVKQVKDYLSNN